MAHLILQLQDTFFNPIPKASNEEEAEAILARPCWGEKKNSKRFLHIFVPAGDKEEPQNRKPLIIAGAEWKQLHHENEEDTIYLHQKKLPNAYV